MSRVKMWVLLAAVALSSSVRAEWKNFDDEHYVCGPKLTSAQLKGKVVLVDMWATWCGPCRAMTDKDEAKRHLNLLLATWPSLKSEWAAKRKVLGK